MMVQNRITAVSYLNTIPFVYGIECVGVSLRKDMLLAVPSECTHNFITNKADIALIPSADLKNITNYKIVTDFCIGAESNVRSVALMSNCPIEQIETIYLDSHSHTSVALVKLLSKERWSISPQWKELQDYSTVGNGSHNDAFLLIGDKVFDYESQFDYIYDLASEWVEQYSMPFVFAVWVAKEHVEQEQIDLLNDALKFGISHIEDAVDNSRYSSTRQPSLEYLKNNISFLFTENKRRALRLFLEKIPPSSAL